jgi:hypothetical protein
MADETDLLLAAFDKQRAQAKQSEDQRASTTDKLMLVFLALQGIVVQRRFDKPSLALAVIIVCLGVYGLAITEKYYERFRLHVCRVGRIQERLQELNPKANIDELERIADAKRKPGHPLMYRVRLHILWRLLHCGVLLSGIASSVIIVWLRFVRWQVTERVAVTTFACTAEKTSRV